MPSIRISNCVPSRGSACLFSALLTSLTTTSGVMSSPQMEFLILAVSSKRRVTHFLHLFRQSSRRCDSPHPNERCKGVVSPPSSRVFSHERTNMLNDFRSNQKGLYVKDLQNQSEKIPFSSLSKPG